MSGLYIHIPFCRSKCAYCDFYSMRCDVNVQEKYIEALIKEMYSRKDELREPVDTVYIGGGTPSLLPVKLLCRLTTCVNEWNNFRDIKEWTIEANPEDVDASFLKMIADEGINRLSIGVQSFSDDLLKRVNRLHSRKSSIEAMSLLSSFGWNYSTDLIYALPGQSLAEWREDLDTLLEFNPPHFSAYLLSIEHGTKLNAMIASGKLTECPEDEIEEMYGYLVEKRIMYGYEHYEIANFSKPGFRSLHNSGYWKSIPYLGIGASAHSFDGEMRRFNPSSIKRYINDVNKEGAAFDREIESLTERLNDYIFTSLRTSDGIDAGYIERAFPAMSSALLKRLSEEKRLVAHGRHFFIPEKNYLVADAIIRDLMC